MKKKICMILIAVFVAVLGTSTYFIIDHHKESNKQAALYDELAELVDAATQTDAGTEPAEQIPYSEEKMLLPELAELYQQNGDLVGWISIADTNINYPVMQSVNEPNFYLKHGFDKEFRIFNRKPKAVELICNNGVIDSIIDRFGEYVKFFANDIKPFRVVVDVGKSICLIEYRGNEQFFPSVLFTFYSLRNDYISGRFRAFC